jgi:hypothetical protein
MVKNPSHTGSSFYMKYEVAGLTGDFGTYLVRSLLSEGRICYDTVEKIKDGLKARRIEREGPTGLIATTTELALHSGRLGTVPDVRSRSVVLMQSICQTATESTSSQSTALSSLVVAGGAMREGL